MCPTLMEKLVNEDIPYHFFFQAFVTFQNPPAFYTLQLVHLDVIFLLLITVYIVYRMYYIYYI